MRPAAYTVELRQNVRTPQHPFGASMKRFPQGSKLAVLWVALYAVSAVAQNSPASENHGIAVANMDRSVKPGEDFYHYANGDWIKRTELPADRAEIDVFSKLADLSNKRTADLIEEIAK